MKTALLLLLAAAASVVLSDEVFEVPAGQWRWVRFGVHQRPQTVSCRFETIGNGEVRAELVSRAELEALHRHQFHDTLATSDSGRSGGFSQYIEEQGEYAVVVENTGNRPVRAHVVVSVSFLPRQVGRYLAPGRRLTVIVISFAGFFLIVTFSARALLRAMRKT